MADYTPNNNMKVSDHGKKKPVIAAVSVIAALTAILIIFLASKNSVFLSLAKYNAKNGNFAVASALVGHSGHEDAAAVEEYINLRADINTNYPTLLIGNDSMKIKNWAETAERLCGESEALGEVLSAEATKLSLVLSQMVLAEEEYIALKSDILDMMDIFKIIAVGMTGAVLAGVLKNWRGEFVIPVITVTGIVIIYMLSDYMVSLNSTLSEILLRYEMDISYIKIVVKVILIAYICQFSCDMLKDAGFSSVAVKVELAGKIVIFSYALPVAEALLEVGSNLLGNM